MSENLLESGRTISCSIVHHELYSLHVAHPDGTAVIGSSPGQDRTSPFCVSLSDRLYSNMARRYDSRTTTFSPEGRLYQARFDPAKTAKMNFV